LHARVGVAVESADVQRALFIGEQNRTLFRRRNRVNRRGNQAFQEGLQFCRFTQRLSDERLHFQFAFVTLARGNVFDGE